MPRPRGQWSRSKHDALSRLVLQANSRSRSRRFTPTLGGRCRYSVKAATAPPRSLQASGSSRALGGPGLPGPTPDTGQVIVCFPYGAPGHRRCGVRFRGPAGREETPRSRPPPTPRVAGGSRIENSRGYRSRRRARASCRRRWAVGEMPYRSTVSSEREEMIGHARPECPVASIPQVTEACALTRGRLARRATMIERQAGVWSLRTRICPL
jgi:hypothetical protein